MSISGELIVSRYVAESITTDAGRFGHVRRPLSTAYKPVRPILFMYVLLYNCDVESNLLCSKYESMSKNLVGFLCN